jgi:phosphotransferase system  glucose/maltose/N-acetylglucosamine-specific IIC component
MDTLIEILAEPLALLAFVGILLGATSLITRIVDGTWNIIDPELRR